MGDSQTHSFTHGGPEVEALDPLILCQKHILLHASVPHAPLDERERDTERVMAGGPGQGKLRPGLALGYSLQG